MQKVYEIVLLLIIALISSCNSKSNTPKEIPLTILEDSVLGHKKAAVARSTIVAKLADGLELNLWASDSLAPDPIAMDIDTKGRIYLTRTNRQKNSEFDIRGYQHWMTPSISMQTVEDRRAFLRKTFAPELSAENEWFPDLNADGSHDWKDLTVEKDEVWMLEDTNNDGLADVSKRILEDFNEEITDVAGGLLVRDDDVFVGVGPDMWRLTDTNEDGVLDEKTSIAHGFAVHIGFGAHGMSGVVEGPDGKIYWGIGDIGGSLTAVNGDKHHLPNQGMIVRSNPDGSDFEVFARGLRNTHEFVFDAYGNIISSDNDGDHRGESERLVHIVEGSDAGWRSNWQYGKYTDPKNNGYKVWMDEKLYLPRWEGQAAYIIPPIQNFHNGPTGMIYNPGTALGKEWLNRFFLVEFVGDPSRSHIWSFNLKPKGASFELDTDIDMLSGVLPTGIKFGPDGALYLADWINGWDTKNFGRIWKLDVTPENNNLEKERLETARLMTLDYDDQSNDELVKLLSYPDMRIRQKAQFALAKSTFWGYRKLKKVLEESDDQYAKIHAIWGIGQVASNDLGKAEPLVSLLSNDDSELIAQALKVLGDVKYNKAAANYIPLLQHENDRVKFYAAQALGRIKYEPAIEPLLKMIENNADQDVYLRHAGVLALSRIGKTKSIAALANSENRSLRIAAVLVLRRIQSPEVAVYLNDPDEYIVTEAARAINDDWSIEEALPALANLLTEQRFTSEPLLRRSINAALRVGGEKNMHDLIAFAKNTNRSSELRGEALAALGTWGSPSVLDRVDGRVRGELTRDASGLKLAMEKEIPVFLSDKDPDILMGLAKTLENLGVDTKNKELFTIMTKSKSAEVRATMLTALATLEFENIEVAMQLGMKDKEQMVREVAVGLLAELDLSKADIARISDPIFSQGSLGEQQQMLGVLGEMTLEKSQGVLSNLIQKANRGLLNEGVLLDLIEAAEGLESEELNAQLGQLKGNGHTAESYKETMSGGNWWNGQTIFNNNPTAQCVRCHAVGGAGGQVGPALDDIATILSPQEILESLIEPSKRLAPGYGNVTVTLKDGQIVKGILEEENEHELIIRTSDAEPMEIAISRIKKRKNSNSSMPALGRLISKRELRDLMAYLTSLKKID